MVDEVKPRWKVAVIVTAETKKYTERAKNNLRECGFEDLDVFAPRGVALSDSENLIRQRCRREATESELFVEALGSLGTSFIASTDFVLLMRADVRLWRDAKLLLENTIEPNFVGVYFPYAPSPFFLGGDTNIPCSGFGWCEVRVDEPVSGAACVAFNKHTAALLAQPAKAIVKRNACEVNVWDYNLSTIIRDMQSPCFVHTPSLGRSYGHDDATAVPFEARLSPVFKQRNLYLN